MTIDQLMVGAIDLQVHGAPEPIEGPRRVNLFELAQQAKAGGMKGVIIKSLQFGTITVTALVNEMINSPVLIGSLVRCNSANKFFSYSTIQEMLALDKQRAICPSVSIFIWTKHYLPILEL
jgi:hypothetical protein